MGLGSTGCEGSLPVWRLPERISRVSRVRLGAFWSRGAHWGHFWLRDGLHDIHCVTDCMY